MLNPTGSGRLKIGLSESITKSSIVVIQAAEEWMPSPAQRMLVRDPRGIQDTIGASAAVVRRSRKDMIRLTGRWSLAPLPSVGNLRGCTRSWRGRTGGLRHERAFSLLVR
jgi:hypothetical protein